MFLSQATSLSLLRFDVRLYVGRLHVGHYSSPSLINDPRNLWQEPRVHLCSAISEDTGGVVNGLLIKAERGGDGGGSSSR